MIIPQISPYKAKASENIKISTAEAKSEGLKEMACVELSPTTPTVIPLTNWATPQQSPALR
jgi:hypothetical protein